MGSKGPVVGVAEAAKALGVTDRQVRNLILKGYLKADRFGGSYVIQRADLARVPKNRKPGRKPKSKGTR